MNTLTTTAPNPSPALTTPKPPPPTHPAIEAMLSAGLGALDDGSLHRELVPAGVLVSLRNRRTDLTAALAPATPDGISRVLVTLGGMPSSATPKNSTEAALLARQDVEDLAGLTQWALEEAARAYRQGKFGPRPFRPTAAELRRAALDLELKHRTELYRIGRLLDAPALAAPKKVPISPERFRELKNRLGTLTGAVSSDAADARK